ncbi:MAG: hypothetical protein U0575_13215 [Phycisphaerales bacterium]
MRSSAENPASPQRRRRRAVVSLILLGAFLVAAMGRLPAMTPRSRAEGGERFPCEACGCGCASATECWLHCCCYAPEERLAWAEREGVEPPGALRAMISSPRCASVASAVAVAGTDAGAIRCAACRKTDACEGASNAASNVTSSPGADEMARASSSAASGSPAGPGAAKEVAPRRVSPLACKGRSASLVVAPFVSLPAGTGVALLPLARCDRLGPPAPLVASSRVIELASPPPRA